MAQLKKIIVSLPDSLLCEIDSIVSLEKTSRSSFVREAMNFYIREKCRLAISEKMRKGYQEMAKINLEIAAYGLAADNETMFSYEEKLSECE